MSEVEYGKAKLVNVGGVSLVIHQVAVTDENPNQLMPFWSFDDIPVIFTATMWVKDDNSLQVDRVEDLQIAVFDEEMDVSKLEWRPLELTDVAYTLTREGLEKVVDFDQEEAEKTGIWMQNFWPAVLDLFIFIVGMHDPKAAAIVQEDEKMLTILSTEPQEVEITFRNMGLTEAGDLGTSDLKIPFLSGYFNYQTSFTEEGQKLVELVHYYDEEHGRKMVPGNYIYAEFGVPALGFFVRCGKIPPYFGSSVSGLIPTKDQMVTMIENATPEED